VLQGDDAGPDISLGTQHHMRFACGVVACGPAERVETNSAVPMTDMGPPSHARDDGAHSPRNRTCRHTMTVCTELRWLISCCATCKTTASAATASRTEAIVKGSMGHRLCRSACRKPSSHLHACSSHCAYFGRRRTSTRAEARASEAGEERVMAAWHRFAVQG
jgi:hypothetical protein